MPSPMEFAFEGDQVGETASRRDVEQRVSVVLRSVRDVLHEQQHKDVILVLRGVHASAKLVTAVPQRVVQVGFLDGH